MQRRLILHWRESECIGEFNCDSPQSYEAFPHLCKAMMRASRRKALAADLHVRAVLAQIGLQDVQRQPQQPCLLLGQTSEVALPEAEWAEGRKRLLRCLLRQILGSTDPSASQLEVMPACLPVCHVHTSCCSSSWAFRLPGLEKLLCQEALSLQPDNTKVVEALLPTQCLGEGGGWAAALPQLLSMLPLDKVSGFRFDMCRLCSGACWNHALVCCTALAVQACLCCLHSAGSSLPHLLL